MKPTRHYSNPLSCHSGRGAANPACLAWACGVIDVVDAIRAVRPEQGCGSDFDMGGCDLHRPSSKEMYVRAKNRTLRRFDTSYQNAYP